MIDLPSPGEIVSTLTPMAFRIIYLQSKMTPLTLGGHGFQSMDVQIGQQWRLAFKSSMVNHRCIILSLFSMKSMVQVGAVSYGTNWAL